MIAPMLGRLLIVDDEAELLRALCEMLMERGYEVVGLTSGAEVLKALEEEDFDLLLSDLMMPEMDGIALLRAALSIDPKLIGLIMTGHGTVQTAVEAMTVGAFDYILKPFSLSTLLPTLARAMEVRRLKLENVELRETVAIHELSKLIAFTLDPGTLLNKVADAALLQCEADEASVMVLVPEGDALRIAVVRGEQREHLVGERVPMGQSIAGWVAVHHETLTLQGEVRDSRFAPITPRPEIRSSISMPMLAGGKLVGVLNVNFIKRRRPITLGHMKALSILTSTASSALVGAELHQQLREARMKYQSIFDNALEGIFQSTPDDGHFLIANQAMARIFGYASPEELMTAVTDIGSQLFADADRRTEFLSLLETQGVVNDFEFESRRKDGRVIWLSIHARAVHDATGRCLYLEGLATNITERKHAEDALRVSEERYRELIENARDVIYTVDLSGNFTSINKAVEQISGYNRGEILGLGFLKFVAPEYQEQVHEMFERKFTNGLASIFELEVLAKDGRRVPFEVSSRPLYQENKIVEVQGIARDITERKRLEAQIRQSQKMESIGTLAGGIAHDFNNILTGILGFSELAMRQITEQHPLYERFLEIKRLGERAATLTRQLLVFASKQVMKRKSINLNEIITSSSKFLRRVIPEYIDLELDLAEDPPRVDADPSQVEQVLMNLCVNSRDAMSTGGKLLIKTTIVSLDEAFCQSNLWANPGEYVQLLVSDTGIGMDRTTLERIFEPFFTTKESGQGTGLGLSTVFGIVRQHDGLIHVNSEVGQGTTVNVFLPTATARPLEEERSVESSPPDGDETILVVEDEYELREMIETVLASLGYCVLTASDGTEALEVLDERDWKVDLILCDIVMRKLGGRGLFEALQHRHSEIKFLFMSGYPSSSINEKYLTDESVELLHKPFTMHAMASLIRKVLDEPAATERIQDT